VLRYQARISKVECPVKPLGEMSEFSTIVRGSTEQGYSHGRWWTIRPALCKPTSGRFFVMRQSGETISPWSGAPSDFF
jgi:hypothetical protein